MNKYTPKKRLRKFWERVDKSGGEDNCWIWTGGMSAGCGVMLWEGRVRSAHHIAYMLEVGELSSGKKIIHLCGNNACVNPKHLAIKGTIAADASRFWSKVDQSGGEDACWEWQASRHSAGYGRFRWLGGYTGTHRVAYELAYGDIGESHVLHKCDNPSCCNPRHLWLGTHQENMADRGRKGRSNGRKVISDRQVVEIRKRYSAGGISQRSLAKQYGVSQSAINCIVSRRTRKDAERRCAENKG